MSLKEAKRGEWSFNSRSKRYRKMACDGESAMEDYERGAT